MNTQYTRQQFEIHKTAKAVSQRVFEHGELVMNLLVQAASMAALVLCVSALSNGAFANESVASFPDVTGLTSKTDTRGNLFDSRNTHDNGIEGWAVSFDNDALVPGSRDQDYTYGLNATIVGDATSRYWVSPNRPLNWINRNIGLTGSSSRPAKQLFEFGLYGFTPEDISNPEPTDSDRPYASLAYVSSIQELNTDDPNTTLRTSLTIGVLGLDLVGNVQKEVHKVTSSEDPKGWNHQISDGGELTARYSIARQRLWSVAVPGVEIKTTSQVSLGYLTEASYSVSLRIGKIASRWQSFNPEVASYGEQSNQSVDEQYQSESYWMLGAAVKARVYNAFLQGQFKDSAVEYDRGDLNTGIFEAWVGYSHAFNRGFRLTYLIRGHTSEVNRGDGDRNVVWGGLTLSRKL